MFNFMKKENTYGCPILIKELDKMYGSNQEKEEITLSDYPDVEKFLKEKEDFQKRSEEVHFIFK